LHIFGGQDFDAKGTATIPGWRGKASEYPFLSCPWIGGTVEVSGYYVASSASVSNSLVSASSTTNTQVYTFLIGPSVSVRRGRIQPFADALIGVVHGRAKVLVSGFPTGTISGSSSASNLGTAPGAGVDFPLSSRWRVRTEANWLREFASGISVDYLEASAGLSFRF
jgi:opacity protein-like surface antigen